MSLKRIQKNSHTAPYVSHELSPNDRITSICAHAKIKIERGGLPTRFLGRYNPAVEVYCANLVLELQAYSGKCGDLIQKAFIEE